MASYTSNFTANVVTSADISREIVLTITPNIQDWESNYSFAFEYTIGNYTYKSAKVKQLQYTVIIPDEGIDACLETYWENRNVTASWKAYAYYTTKKGSITYYTNDANLGLVIPNYGHTIDVTIEDVNSTTLALTGDASKFIYPYSVPKFTITIGHQRAADKSAIKNINTTMYEPPEDNGMVDIVYEEATMSPIAGQTSYTKIYTSNVPLQYMVDVGYTDTRNYSGTLTYAPSTWNGSTYRQPYMVNNNSFARTAQDFTVVKLSCQPYGWLQSFGVQSNTLTLTIQVKEYGQADSSYVTTNTISILSNPSTVTDYTVTHTFVLNKNYVCRWILSDLLTSVQGEEQILTSLYPVFAISNSRMDMYGSVYVHSLDANNPEDIVFDDIGSLIDSLFYKPGDTTVISNMLPIPGYITTSSKDMRFNITVGKSLKKISNVSVTSMYGLLRGVNGYIEGSSYQDWVTKTGITITPEIAGEHSVKILVSSTTALSNATNNTPVIFAPYSNGLTLTFGGS